VQLISVDLYTALSKRLNMRRAFEQGSFGYARCHAASSTVRNHLKKIPEKNGAHTYTSLFGGKFQLKTTDKDLLEEYAKDSSTFFLSLIEKPPNRDLRPLVVDIDKVPPELFGDGEIVAEIRRVFIQIIQERLEGVAEEDLENLEQTKGPQFFNAHLIWKKIVVAEVAAKYITKLATEKMKEKYPKYDWSDIIDASLTGANGLRMLGSYKPYPINKLRQNYPDIWLKHYAPDESGNPTKHCNIITKRPYLLPDLDGGVYMPKGHEGGLTIRELQEHSIIVDDTSKVFQVNAEYINDLADLTEVSKGKFIFVNVVVQI
jgi:hypothetical protein